MGRAISMGTNTQGRGRDGFSELQYMLQSCTKFSEMTNIYFKGNYYSSGSGNHSWICVCVCVCVWVGVGVIMTIMMFQGAGSNLQELRFSQWCCSKIQVFCEVMLCHWANSFQLFGTITASHSRRCESPISQHPLWL